MVQWIKQSTAVTVKAGPFVDATDGVTAETALTISQADIRLSKNGGAFAQSNNAAGATHDENGYYGVPLDTTDTGTLGSLRMTINEAGALKVWQDFMVVPANVWDSMFGADLLQVHAAEITAGLITATSIAADAITAAKVAADVHAEAADAVWDEATAGHTTADTFGEQVKTDIDAILVDTAEIGAAGAGLTALATAANLATVDTVVDAILLDTGTDGVVVAAASKTGYSLTATTGLGNQTADITGSLSGSVGSVTGHTAQTGDSFARLGAPAGASHADDVAAVKTQTAAIEVDTADIQARLPAALTGAGNMKSDALAINGNTDAAARLDRGTRGTTLGTCDAGSTTSAVVASSLVPASVVNDQWNGKIMTFDMNTTTTGLRGQSTDITDYVHATLTFTVTALTTAPASGDTFTIS